MKISLISFTRQGAYTCKKIEKGLRAGGHESLAYGMPAYAGEAGLLAMDADLGEWTKRAYRTRDVLVFVGACGIAVRSIAPYVKDKTQDPAVVVVDEMGRYAISLLSGHIGGANHITLEIAKILGAEPIVTTATDIHGKFAVDQWAKSQNLFIEDMVLAKKISVALLEGKPVGVYSDYPIQGEVPQGLMIGPGAEGLPLGFQLSIFQGRNRCEGKPNKYGIQTLLGQINQQETQGSLNQINQREAQGQLDQCEKTFPETLYLTPKILTLGIGCRKGATYERIKKLVDKVFKELGISLHAIEKLCSIDLKGEEPGLLQLSQTLKVPFQVFSAEELKEVEGSYSRSNFVAEITGVDNVCERAAVLGSKGQLIIKKQSLAGVTLAVAMRKEEYTWNQ
ncbi:MAG: cobalt-precorrin 5A hydrolase [Anaerovoracaceae bacterium]|jgi:cobalt-precorrin 5A hydrolase